MGSCISHQPLALVPTDSDPEPDCFLCYQSTTCLLPLRCGHTACAECLAKWWCRNPHNGLLCPFCRQKSYECFLEISAVGNKPVGYYRQDAENGLPMIFRKAEPDEKTKFVRLPEVTSRDMALFGCLEYMRINNPSQPERLLTVP